MYTYYVSLREYPYLFPLNLLRSLLIQMRAMLGLLLVRPVVNTQPLASSSSSSSKSTDLPVESDFTDLKISPSHDDIPQVHICIYVLICVFVYICISVYIYGYLHMFIYFLSICI
jgi:hypothetical protein